MEITASWEAFKANIDEHELSISYADRNGNYYLFTNYSGFDLVCRIDKTSEAAAEFEADYKEESTEILT